MCRARFAACWLILVLALTGLLTSARYNLGWMSGHGLIVGLASGRLVLAREATTPSENPEAGWSFRKHAWNLAWAPLINTPTPNWNLSIPMWIPAALAAACLLRLRQLAAQRVRRLHSGACPQCGYDRRNTQPRLPCPECGITPQANIDSRTSPI